VSTAEGRCDGLADRACGTNEEDAHGRNLRRGVEIGRRLADCASC